MIEVDIPYEWCPRAYQLPAWKFMDRDAGRGKRAICVWHRRAGKDTMALNLTAALAHDRVGTYWHMLPEAAQARKVIWDGINQSTGKPWLDQVFPPDIRSRRLEQEMRIELKCGSAWQLCGSDNYNSLVGSDPIGVVFSEYSLADPSAWDYIRPILAVNGGWAMFLFTPRGRNHSYDLFSLAQALQAKQPDNWFSQILTVEDTNVLTPEQIAKERESGMEEDLIAQEYYCSFAGARQGSIYGEQMRIARQQARVCKLGFDRRFPVNTFWDLGHSDSTAIIAHQTVGGQERFLKAFKDHGRDLVFYVSKMLEWQRENGFIWGNHYLPHDSRNVTLAAKGNPLGDSAWDQLRNLGLQNMVLVPRVRDVWDGINSTRARFGTCWFDEVGASDLISSLDSYHKKWDDAKKCYTNTPVHDWASDLADAFRQFGQGYNGPAGSSGKFTLPGNLPSTTRMMPRIRTVGNLRSGY